LFHAGGFNQRWAKIFVKNYYMDKKKEKGRVSNGREFAKMHLFVL
jgi:hypothetical protein